MLVPHDRGREMIGAYAVQQVLGRGRLSTLYIALHPYTTQKVAITAFTVTEGLDEQAQLQFSSHFTREISALATLRHPHILGIDDYGEQDGHPYFVLPAVIADTLQKHLKQKGRFNPLTALPLLRQMAEALDYAHVRGIVHGGLKPANILLYPHNHLQITGFGLERILAQYATGSEETTSWSHLMSVTGTILGQLEYMAPEYVQGKVATPLSDIYSLGCIVFALLNGKPFVEGTPFEILGQQIQTPVPSLAAVQPHLRPELCARLDLVLQQALHPDPAERYQRVGDFAEAYLQAVLPYLEHGNIFRKDYQFTPIEDDEQDNENIIDSDPGNEVTTRLRDL